MAIAIRETGLVENMCMSRVNRLQESAPIVRMFLRKLLHGACVERPVLEIYFRDILVLFNRRIASSLRYASDVFFGYAHNGVLDCIGGQETCICCGTM